MFTPLHLKSAYSLLQSPIDLATYVQRAKDLGYQTVVLNEWQTMASAPAFLRLCQDQGLKPVFGISFSLLDCQLSAFGKGMTGYNQLINLSSNLMSGTKVNWEQKDQIHYLLTPERGEDLDRLDQVKALLGIKTLYVALKKNQESLLKDPRLADYPILVSQTVDYLQAQDYPKLKVLQALRAGEQLDPSILGLSGQNYLPSADAYAQNWLDPIWQEALINTQTFLESCPLDIAFHLKLLPKFSNQADQDLQALAYQGLKERGLASPIYEERLAKELSIIQSMGFSDYFLMVWDLLVYARSQNILMGAGRGSSAASLVAYCLNITQVDPVKHDLLFERFLNPERYTMPDIDLDFPDNRRGDMLSYALRKYGADKVAQIATFGTFGAKQAIRDVVRVFKKDPEIVNAWSKALGPTGQLDPKRPALKRLIDQQPYHPAMVDLAQSLIGLPRHWSTHAAGVVISDQPLTQHIPIMAQSADQLPQTQYTMGDVEAVGLLKLDFLGLKNLSILADALAMIRQKEADFDLYAIDFADPATLALFAKGDTEGVFQFESAGIKRVLQQVKPDSLDQLAAVNALFRPGPMEQIGHYVARKFHKEPIHYAHPVLEKILKETYGIIVYQEQVMQTASTMAGFSLGQADLLRRAMSKKDASVMAMEREKFLAGGLTQGYSSSECQLVFDYIEKFANYGFAKSHAYAYAVLAYQMAYIKAHYPEIFYIALMLHVDSRSPKYALYITEAKQHGISFLLPDINKSQAEAKAMGNKRIRLGLSNIRGLSSDLILEIQKERQKGPYQSLQDFADRMGAKSLNEQVLAKLIKAGALDGFKKTRASLLAERSSVLENRNFTLFADLTAKEKELPELTEAEVMAGEQETLGFAFSINHFEPYLLHYERGELQKSTDIVEGQRVQLLGHLQNIRRIQTRNHKHMAFAQLEDAFGKIGLTLFPQVYQASLPYQKEEGLLLIQGRIEKDRQGELQCLVDSIGKWQDHLKKAQASLFRCVIRLEKAEDLNKLLPRLQRHPGNMNVLVYISNEKRYVKLSANYGVTGSRDLVEDLEKFYGNGSVVIQKIKE